MATMSVGHFPVSSKLLQKKWNEKQYKTHKLKIASMKADIDNKNKHGPPKMNLKKLQVEEDARAVVDNENKVLLERVSRIMRERGTLDNWNESYKPRSLNRRIRTYQASKIQNENDHIVRRLNAIKPLYDIRKWENDFLFHEYVLSNMKSTTKDYETVPNMRSPRNHSPPRVLEKLHHRPVISSDNYLERDTTRERRTRQLYLPKIAQKRDIPPPMAMTEFDPVKDAGILHNCNKDTSSTDTTILIHSLALRNFRERIQICAAHERLFNQSLEEALLNQISPSYHYIVTALLSRREAYDADILHEALESTPCEDWRENVLIELICTRHDLALEAIKKEYEAQFNTTITQDITTHTNGDLKVFLSTLLLKDRSTNLEVDEELALSDAEKLLAAEVDDRWSSASNSSHFTHMVAEQGYAQIRAAFIEYERLTGLDVEGSVISVRVGSKSNQEYWNAVLAFVRCLRNCPAFFAICLHQSVRHLSKQRRDSVSTSDEWAEKTIIRCVITRSEADLSQICRVYRKRFGISLYNDIHTHCHSLPRKRHEKRIAGMIIAGPPARSLVTRPPPTMLITKEELRNNPLNQSSSRITPSSVMMLRRSNENKRGTNKKTHGGTVRQSRDFCAEKDAEILQNTLTNWDSCDHKPFLSVMTQRSSDQRQKIAFTYASRFKRDLISDLQRHIKEKEYAQLLKDWVTNRMEFDAVCLHKSITTPKEEYAAMELLSTRPNRHVKSVTDVYRRLYGSTIQEAIKENVKNKLWRKVLLGFASADKDSNVSQNYVSSQATTLYEETVSGTGAKQFIQIFTRGSLPQIQAVLAQYHKISGKDLEIGIQNSSDIQDEVKHIMGSIIQCRRDPALYFSYVLKQVFNSSIKEFNLLRIFVTRAEVDLEAIKFVYKQKYEENLTESIDNFFSSKPYKEFLNSLLNPSNS